MIIENPSTIFKNCFFIFEKNVFLMKNNSFPPFETIQKIHIENPDFYFMGEMNGTKDGGEKGAVTTGNAKDDEKNDFCVLLAQCEEQANTMAEKYGLFAVPIRQFFFENDFEKGRLLSRAKNLAVWGRKMRFCPECGSKLVCDAYENAKICTRCGESTCNAPNRTGLYFPRIEPCVIVLVERGEKILLVRHTYRNQDIFACVAGFIEAGESAENAVFREVLEETGIKIKNIRYKGSQSWPFPDQLMLAFTAEYESGDFSLQKSEIAEAAWFSRDALPPSPKPGSVAYRLINGLF